MQLDTFLRKLFADRIILILLHEPTGVGKQIDALFVLEMPTKCSNDTCGNNDP